MIIRDDIAAYDQARPDLELKYRGKWAVFHAGDFIGAYPDYEAAASIAVERFGADGEQWHRVILGLPFLGPYRMIYNATPGQVEIVTG